MVGRVRTPNDPAVHVFDSASDYRLPSSAPACCSTARHVAHSRSPRTRWRAPSPQPLIVQQPVRHIIADRVQAWELEVTGAASMTLREYYKRMLLDYGFSRDEVATVVDAAPSDDFDAILDALHTRHIAAEAAAEAAGCTAGDGGGGGAADGGKAGAHGLVIRLEEQDDDEMDATETEESGMTPETTPGSSIAQTPS